ncbi:DUF4880 domain-containing protein [Achromobacter xylosoxidans]|uniref:DUF4880 domain-containing protein n=1 Tax=Alcaligenes xylosoxydans xylosoxydans TaxID=85698 RepID=UPI00203E142A|nr:DUF4880 domain-containing protein [Achromobacter xylosoxidans]MCM2571157.1 DUF4880 domain-containing protein [Achromobacter xylosoxidans]
MHIPSSDPVVREAIAWWVRLQSGVAVAHERETWRVWVERDPAHREAWERMESIGRDVRRIPAGLAHAALVDPCRPTRRAALRAVLAVASTCMTGWVRIPLMADSDSIPIADSVPGDGGHVARVS